MVGKEVSVHDLEFDGAGVEVTDPGGGLALLSFLRSDAAQK